MGLIVVCGLLLIVAAGLFAAGSYFAYRNHQSRENRDQAEAAKAMARWEVGVDAVGTATRVFVQRRARMPWGAMPQGDPLSVALIPADHAGYEAELARATATARSRAREFNSTLEPDYMEENR